MTLHFILADFGKLGRSYVERDPNEMDLETTLRDLISGQVDRPLSVLAVDPEEGWTRDVSEDCAREIAHRMRDEHLSPALIDFIEKHAGLALARELRAA